MLETPKMQQRNERLQLPWDQSVQLQLQNKKKPNLSHKHHHSQPDLCFCCTEKKTLFLSIFLTDLWFCGREEKHFFFLSFYQCHTNWNTNPNPDHFFTFHILWPKGQRSPMQSKPVNWLGFLVSRTKATARSMNLLQIRKPSFRLSLSIQHTIWNPNPNNFFAYHGTAEVASAIEASQMDWASFLSQTNTTAISVILLQRRKPFFLPFLSIQHTNKNPSPNPKKILRLPR